MEKEVNETILAALQERFPGPLEWISRDLRTLLAERGGAVDGRTMRLGFEPRYGRLYTACIVHGPLVRSSVQLNIPEPYLALLKRFNGAKLYALELYGLLEDESNQRRCM